MASWENTSIIFQSWELKIYYIHSISVCLVICLSVCLSVCLCNLSVSICLFVGLSVPLSVLSLSHSTHLSLSPLVFSCHAICLCVCPSHLAVRMSVRLSVRISAPLSLSPHLPTFHSLSTSFINSLSLSLMIPNGLSSKE